MLALAEKNATSSDYYFRDCFWINLAKKPT